MDIRSYDLVILAIVIWSTQTAASKILVGSLGFIATTFYVSIGTAFAALIAALALKKEKDIKLAMKNWRVLILISIPLTIANLLLFYALTMITASEVIVLLYIYPILIVLFDVIIISHKMSYLEFVGMLVGFLGVYILISYNNSININSSTFLSAIMVIIAAISWAFYLILQKKYVFEEFSSNSLYFFISSLILLPLFVMWQPRLPTFNNLCLIIYMGGVTFALGNILYVKGLKRLKTTNSAFILYLTPFIALIWNFILLGERINIYYLIPLAFIAIGYYIIIIGKKKNLASKQ